MNTIQHAEQTSSQLFRVIEDKLSLDSDLIIFDWIEDTFDGIFTRVSDFKRLINRMDTYGVCEFLTWISKRNNKILADTGYCIIKRENKWDAEAEIIFKEPIEVIFAKVNDQPITGKVDRIKGEFSFEWFWLKNGRQKEVANAFEVYFQCNEYYLDCTPINVTQAA